MKKTALRLSLTAFSALAISGCSFTSDALFPSLFGTETQEEIAAKSTVLPELGSTNFVPVDVSEGSETGTFVGQKVVAFRNELNQLQKSIRIYNEDLQKVRSSVINNAMQYHKTIGTIEAKLQVGTTPGNPHMYGLLQSAQNNIQTMSSNTVTLEGLSAKVTSDAAMTTYLLDSIRAAYSVSGAVDEDHRQLRILENETNQTTILINSLLGEVNSDVERQRQYIDTAKNHIVDLNEAIKIGSYGVNNIPFSAVSATNPASSYTPAASAAVTAGKPLFTAKFNKSNVNYKDGLQQAVRQAKAAKPTVKFNIVAVTPASASRLTKQSAQTHASTIFKEIIEMGVGADKISLSSKSSADANSAEVQIFVK